MNPKRTHRRWIPNLAALLCAAALGVGSAFADVTAARAGMPQTSAPQAAAPIPPDQLDSLVAPIALYPDPLLAQTLAASTYPLEIMQLQQYLTRNPGLKDKALADAVAAQPWDPSVQAMAALPDVVNRLANDVQWTTDLGNAFLAQQADVMNAVQRMRQKAQGTGNLQSTPQQVVETRVVEEKQVIVIEQASPTTVYVPTYNPTVVYGAPVYPYPPIYYPPAGAYAAGMAVSFGVGVAMGAFWGGGGWGWNAGWGHNDININRNNTFVRNTNVGGAYRNTNVAGYRGGGNTWQHNPAHRGGTPYRDSATANRYGGTARGDSLSNRQAAARQQVNRQGGNLQSNRAGAVGTTGSFNRGAAGENRGAAGQNINRGAAGQGQFGGAAANRQSGAAANRASGAGAGATRTPSASARDFSRSGGGADRVGQRDLSRSGSGQSAFGGGSQGFSGSSARANSSRGSSSVQSRPSGSSRSGSFGGSHGGSRSGGGSRSRGGGGGGGRRR
jgi:uncharacterized protein DUF3300